MTDVLVVCSPGGHFDKARALVELFPNDISYKFVVHKPPTLPEDIRAKLIVAPHVGRESYTTLQLIFRTIMQFMFALRCVWEERPSVILSTGALPAVTFGLAGKLRGSKFIYVESPTRVITPSLAGRISYYFADTLYVRHKTLQQRLPNSRYVGPQ